MSQKRVIDVVNVNPYTYAVNVSNTPMITKSNYARLLFYRKLATQRTRSNELRTIVSVPKPTRKSSYVFAKDLDMSLMRVAESDDRLPTARSNKKSIAGVKLTVDYKLRMAKHRLTR